MARGPGLVDVNGLGVVMVGVALRWSSQEFKCGIILFALASTASVEINWISWRIDRRMCWRGGVPRA